MATISVTNTVLNNQQTLFVWGSLANNDDGEWVEVAEWETITVQPGLPSSPSSSFTWEGTNDLGLSPTALSIPATTDRDRNMITPRFRYLRPKNTSGSTVGGAALFATRQC